MTIASDAHMLQRIPISWEEYLARDDLVGDYYEGCFVEMSPPTARHQRIIKRLGAVLDLSAPHGAESLAGSGWSPSGVREALIPDLMVLPVDSDPKMLAEPPMLVVEVLSTNRSDDLVAKIYRYAKWGAPAYWIVDPRDQVLITYELAEDHFVETARYTNGSIVATYDGVKVPLDLDAIFR